MTDIREGDRVRYTVEGTVRDVLPGGTIRFKEVGDYLEYYCEAERGVAKLEILERAKPEVGALVSRDDDPSLPVGTLVAHPIYGQRLKVAAGNRWYYAEVDRVDGLSCVREYTVLYLPE